MSETGDNYDRPTVSGFGSGGSPPEPGGAGLFSPGDRIDDFEIQQEVGRGGMGVVYRAQELSLQRVVALKALYPAILQDPSQAKRFRREAVLAANLSHPNIVPVYHIDQHDPPRYFTMELVEGWSLDVEMKKRRYLRTAEAIRIALSVGGAIQYAHSRSIIHRDIKPGNILLQADPKQVRVTDFGIARDVTGRLAEVTKTSGLTAGTPAFMSPEQNLGRDVDARADIFSLGATLYYMLVGVLPFKARNRQELVLAFREQTPAPPSDWYPDIGEALDEIVLRMIAVDPEQRQATVAEAARQLQECLEHGLHRAPTAVDESPTVIRRRRKRTSLINKIVALGTDRRSLGGMAVFIAAMVVSGALLVAALALWPPGPPNGGHRPGVVMTARDREDWGDLCLALHGWCAQFLADMDKQRLDRWREDPYVRKSVLPILEQVDAGQLRLDPRRFLNTEGATLESMALNPPPQVQKSKALIEETRKALRSVRAIQDGLGPGWGTRKKLKGLAAQYRQRGWGKQARYVESVAPAVEFGPGLAKQVDKVVAAGLEVERLEKDWQQLRKLVEQVKASGSELLKEFDQYVKHRTRDEGDTGRAGDLEAMRRRLATVGRFARELAGFVQPGWQAKLDMDMVEHKPPVPGPPWDANGLRDGSTFRTWLRTIQGEDYQRLSADLDPRNDKWQKEQRGLFTSIDETIKTLAKEHKDPNAPAYAKELAALRKEFDRILALKWNRRNKSKVQQGVDGFGKPADDNQPDLRARVDGAMLAYAGGVEAFIKRLSVERWDSPAIAAYWQERLKDFRQVKSLIKLQPMARDLKSGLGRLDRELDKTLVCKDGEEDWVR